MDTSASSSSPPRTTGRPPDPATLPVLIAGFQAATWLTGDGETADLSPTEATRYARATAPLLCHGLATARRIGADPFPAYDLLELFAFVRPAHFTVPTPAGVAEAVGLTPGQDRARQAAGLRQAAQRLLTELSTLPPDDRKRARGLAARMAGAGWPWGSMVLAALGPGEEIDQAFGVWQVLEDWHEEAPPPPPQDAPVSAEDARARLAGLLGPGAEQRPAQEDYAAALAPAFQPRRQEGAPRAVLAEAGTGIGKTAGYLAPAGLWARRNGWPVWISTYTRNLQHQLDGELDRLFPDAAEKSRRTVVRKGRENYLCLLNYEEATAALAARNAGAGARDVIALGLVARWIGATRSGDMVGGDFPNWLSTLLGWRNTVALTDSRGECTYSACTHYRRCFIESSIRRARRADIVVANHALVMSQAALGQGEERFLPTRYVFDEGHHLFNAADSAFSLHLTGIEGREFRRWLLGAEGGRGRRGGGRARGLARRVGDLVMDNAAAEEALGAIRRQAARLPGENWLARLASGTPQGPFEAFLAELRVLVHARATRRQAAYSLEAEIVDPPDALLEAASDLEAALGELRQPLTQLKQSLARTLENRTAELDTPTRLRIDAAIRGLGRRADGLVAGWRDMLRSLREGSPEAFVEWAAIDRSEQRDSDVGLHRHWLDPTLPFIETLAVPAHGIVVTSATLRDSDEAEDEGWTGALQRTGFAHLVEPAARLSAPSPFDYGDLTRVLVVTDVARDDPDQIAAAFRALFAAARGGGLGLFTAISRLRQTYERLAPALESENLPLYAQHVDAMDTTTLVDVFRAEHDACLLGTDALRDGIDVPGPSLRLIVFDRVPWPRPDVLHRHRRAAFGGARYDDALVRLRLKQAYGRLVRRKDDRGCFVLLDSRMPSRLASAFPSSVEIERVGIREAVRIVAETTHPG
ncbi:MAG: ATP-dependent DNA helicase [Alphaproteobacteria bacterium]